MSGYVNTVNIPNELSCSVLSLLFLVGLHVSHRRALHLAGCFIEVFAHGEVREQVQIGTVHDRTPHEVAVVVGAGAAQVAVVPVKYQKFNVSVMRRDKDAHVYREAHTPQKQNNLVETYQPAAQTKVPTNI